MGHRLELPLVEQLLGLRCNVELEVFLLVDVGAISKLSIRLMILFLVMIGLLERLVSGLVAREIEVAVRVEEVVGGEELVLQLLGIFRATVVALFLHQLKQIMQLEVRIRCELRDLLHLAIEEADVDIDGAEDGQLIGLLHDIFATLAFCVALFDGIYNHLDVAITLAL